MRQHARTRFGDDLRGKSKVIDVRVCDDDPANIFERAPARAQRVAQCGQRRRIVGARIDQRQFIAFGEIAVDRTDRKRRWDRDGLQIIENGTPLQRKSIHEAHEEPRKRKF